MIAKRMLSPKDIAEELGIGRTKATAAAHRIPGNVVVGARVLVPRIAFEEWLAKGGDLCRDVKGRARTSTSEATRGGAGSTTPAATKSDDQHTKSLDRWLKKLQVNSSEKQSKPVKGRLRSA